MNLIKDLKTFTCSVCKDAYQSTHPYLTPKGIEVCHVCQEDAYEEHYSALDSNLPLGTDN